MLLGHQPHRLFRDGCCVLEVKLLEGGDRHGWR
jgi:hypothetical protein